MADWVACSSDRYDGERVYINLDRVARIVRSGRGSVIHFLDTTMEQEIVNESPEEIMSKQRSR